MALQRPTGDEAQRRRVAFAGAFFLWLLFGWINPANAASYTFPGNLPLGCSGSAGSYTCTALTLIAADTITINAPTPATITINGDLDTSGASVNAPGSPSNVRLVVNGVLTAGSGAKITADVTSGSVSNWSGNAWVVNGDDNCSVVPAAAVVRSGYLDNKGALSAAWSTTSSGVTVTGGNAALTLSAPSPLLTGSGNLALNLGPAATATDQSCLAVHPASTGAALPWLRSQNGGCSTAWDRDPSARATFGIYSPESRKVLHVREIF